MTCKSCGKTLTYNEVGLSKKLLGRGTTEPYCKKCLAQMFNVDVKLLDEKQRQFLQAGCTLFVEE